MPEGQAERTPTDNSAQHERQGSLDPTSATPNHIEDSHDDRLRVLIIGGGATGMSAAYAFSHHPDRYDVTLYERSAYAGGMATSAPIDKDKYGADYVNDGVQGASPVFYNTYAIFERLGFGSADVGMQVSFGKGKNGGGVSMEFWSNVFPSQTIDKFKDDIKRFGSVLKIIKTFEPVFALISVSAMLRMFRFSKEFGETIVYPLVALFFGTGNQTPFISSAILERVFMDDNMRLFEYSPESFLASIPQMKAFPKLSLLYEKWKSFVEEESKGSVRVVLNREVTRIQRSSSSKSKRGSVRVWSRITKGTNDEQGVVDPAGEEVEETFDEVIFCTDADAALKVLGEDATFLERRILGNVKYLWDITVTHGDLGYMKKYYQVEHDPELRSAQDEDTNQDKKKQFEFAEKHFAPLYYIRSYPEDRRRIEMSFDLTNYQPQFKGVSPYGPQENSATSEQNANSSGSSTAASSGAPPTSQQLSEATPEEQGSGGSEGLPPPLEKHVFQTIFLDNSPESSKLWSKGEINPEKIIKEKWWKQQSHRWQHYAGTVPWMGLINGKVN
ncbi:hypothetical protein AX16_006404 [Volvariella volvacea WC 439]|nr:hypothetical protein AX16_006404 [Volvariella volvacea WC 439]